MKRLIALLLLSFPVKLWAVEIFEIPPPKGVVSEYHSENMSNEFVEMAENVYFDKDLGPRKRGGYSKDNTVSFGSAAINGLWRFIDPSANQYLIALSSNVLRYSIGGGTYTIISSTIPAGYEFGSVSGMGVQWFASSTQTFYWSGSGPIVLTSTSFPLSALIVTYKNRLVVGKGSTLYLSRHLVGDDWALGGNPTDPVQFTIGINDGDIITGVFTVPNGVLIFKRYSTWLLKGDSQSDFTIKNISNFIGCIQNGSIQIKQEKVYWLSKRGLERLTFNSLLSDIREGSIELVRGNKAIIDKMIQGYDVNTVNSVTDTSQSDFTMGSSTYASVSKVVDSVTIASHTVEYTTAPFNATVSDTMFYENTGDVGGMALSFVPKFNCKILAAGLRVYSKVRSGAPASAPRDHNFIYSLMNGSTEPAAGVALSVADNSPQIHSDTPVNGTTVPVYTEVTFSTGNMLTAGTAYWVQLQIRRYNGAGNDDWGFYPELVTPGTFPSVLVATNIAQASPASSFVLPWSIANTAARGTVVLSSAQFVSSIKDLGTSIARFTTFSANFTANDGVISLFVRSANTNAGVLTAAWTSQVNGSTVAALANEFVQYRVDFGIYFSTQNPSLQDVTIGYVDSTNKQRTVSWVNEDRYFLSNSTQANSTAVNDQILVLDQFDNFTFFRGVNALSYAFVFDKQYFGTSQSTGNMGGFIYAFNSSFLDDTSAINAFIQTKDYCMKDNNCYSDKMFDSIYLKTVNSGSGGGTLSPYFQVDSDGIQTLLGPISLTEKLGSITAKLPLALGVGGIHGKVLKLYMVNNEAGQDFRFYGAKVYYNLLPEPQ